MKYSLYATRDIFPQTTITDETKPLVKAGEVVLTIESPLDLDAAINATRNGSASIDKPKPKEAKKDEKNG